MTEAKGRSPGAAWNDKLGGTLTLEYKYFVTSVGSTIKLTLDCGAP